MANVITDSLLLDSGMDQKIIDKAYKHSLDNYTCEQLIKKIKNNEL